MNQPHFADRGVHSGVCTIRNCVLFSLVACLESSDVSDSFMMGFKGDIVT